MGEPLKPENGVRRQVCVRGLKALTLLFFLLAGAVQARPHDGVEYSKVTAAGVPVHLVTVDLKRADLVIRLRDPRAAVRSAASEAAKGGSVPLVRGAPVHALDDKCGRSVHRQPFFYAY